MSPLAIIPTISLKNSTLTSSASLAHLKFANVSTYLISGFLWDNGASGFGKERHGYVDHGDGSYTTTGEAPVKAMVKAWSTTSETYTLQSVYDKAPVF